MGDVGISLGLLGLVCAVAGTNFALITIANVLKRIALALERESQ
jgi:hypothetical protein